jgi:hypothetical protein
MAKKLTYNFVKEQFEKEGYTLLSKKYVNWKTKLEYRCPNGHEHSISWHNWKAGYRCPYCADDKKRTSICIIKQSFEKEGYELLSKEYKNNKTKLKYKCPKGHIHYIRWNDWKSGKRCYYCNGNIRLTYDFVKSSFEEEGYTLLSNGYKNNNTKLDYICPEGHTHSITWRDWSTGYRCPYCAGNVKLTIEYVREQFKKEGYTLLSKEYINSSTKLSYMCPYGHVHEITYGNWRSGWRCPTCKGISLSINRSGPGHPNWQGGKSFEPYCEIWKDKEFKLDIMERDAYSCLNPYCDSKRPDDLTIHHIDYNKQNCHPSNLITVCRSCNSRANKNRKWHKAWYQAIMHKRYNYKY